MSNRCHFIQHNTASVQAAWAVSGSYVGKSVNYGLYEDKTGLSHVSRYDGR